MPCVVYKELVRKGKQLVWVEKILITTDKDRVVYDGVFDKKNEKILNWIDKYADNPDEFKRRHNLI